MFEIKLLVFKKKCLYYKVGHKFVSVLELEILFVNINEVVYCKIFLRLLCMLPDKAATYSIERITPASQDLAFLGFFLL